MFKTGKFMKKLNNRKKLDNRGVSLVEIIIGMLILSVVTIPVMQVMVTSMQYNAKAREKQVEVATAEGIFEVFKAYNVEELCGQFAAEDITKQVKGIKLENPVSGSTVVGYDTPGASGSSVYTLDPLTGIYSYKGSDTDRYTFQLENIVTDIGKFDAVIEVNGISLTDAAGADVRQESLVFTSMNKYSDAVYMNDYNWEDRAWEETAKNEILKITMNNIMSDPVWSYPNAYIIDYTQLDPDKIILTQKKSYIFLEQTGDVVTGSIKRQYLYEIHDMEYPKSDGTTGLYSHIGQYPQSDDWNTWTDTTEVFYDNTAFASEGIKIENLYYYFYPCYNKVGHERDVIRIYSNLDYGVNYHVFKQKNPYMTNSDLYLKESTYGIFVDCWEECANDAARASKKTKLYHNLKENLSDFVVNTDGSKMSTSSNVGIVFTKYETDGSGNRIASWVNNANFESYSYQDEHVSERAILYKVDIKLYKDGDTTRPVATFQGTMND